MSDKMTLGRGRGWGGGRGEEGEERRGGRREGKDWERRESKGGRSHMAVCTPM